MIHNKDIIASVFVKMKNYVVIIILKLICIITKDHYTNT